MKKTVYIILTFLLITLLVGCNNGSDLSGTSADLVQEENVNYNNTTNEVAVSVENEESQKNVTIESDSSKCLLLSFINNEIPLVDYPKIGDVKYYNDISDSNISLDESTFYVLDVDGDGVDEYGYYYYPMLNIIKYNKVNDDFELWLSVDSKQRPIGNGELISIITSQPIIYEYYKYDEGANMVESIYYRTGEEVDEETGEVKVIYEINGESVSEEVWISETEYFFLRKDKAPNPLTYQELFE